MKILHADLHRRWTTVGIRIARWGTTGKNAGTLARKVKTFEGLVRYQRELHVAAGKGIPKRPKRFVCAMACASSR